MLYWGSKLGLLQYYFERHLNILFPGPLHLVPSYHRHIHYHHCPAVFCDQIRFKEWCSCRYYLLHPDSGGTLSQQLFQPPHYPIMMAHLASWVTSHLCKMWFKVSFVLHAPLQMVSIAGFCLPLTLLNFVDSTPPLIWIPWRWCLGKILSGLPASDDLHPWRALAGLPIGSWLFPLSLPLFFLICMAGLFAAGSS